MRDPVLIAAILQELGYLDEKKEKGKTEEGHNEERNKDHLKNRGEEKK